MSEAGLEALVAAAGLQPDWQDYRGRNQRVGEAALRHTLGCLGLPAESPAQIAESFARLAHDGADGPLLSADTGDWLPLPAALRSVRVLVREDDGAEVAAEVADGRLRAPREPGYYRVGDGAVEHRLAVAPPRAFPAALEGRRAWGSSAQIYSLPRAGDDGIGDFTALAGYAGWLGGQGADALATSPLHALFAGDVQRYSPYSPSSRLFLNVLYGDPSPFESGPSAASAATGGLIDWPASARARLARLRAAYAVFRQRAQTDGALAEDYRSFCAQGGMNLSAHARFEALSTEFGGSGWQQWPAEFRDPASPAVVHYAAAHAEEVEFHRFAQWLARRGLEDAQTVARGAGMGIGLIGDLAVGTDAGGSHAWTLQQGLLRGLSVGAPPDLLAPQGQNWGLTTFAPHALAAQGYAPFIDLLRANLDGVGGLRIDHVLGLRRLWVAPDGGSAGDGVYLRYPLETLLRLIRLEAWRHGALIIGEDLGTVPGGLREQLQASGVQGLQVLWFERDHGFFIAPSRWSAHSIATTTTHDLPSVAGWWRGRDLDWRAKAEQFGADADEASERASRAHDRHMLWGALIHDGLVSGPQPADDDTAAVVDAAIAFVADAPAPLALVPVEDLLGLDEQPNLPGTIDQHPNWRRRLPLAVEALDAAPQALARTAALRARRPRA